MLKVGDIVQKESGQKAVITAIGDRDEFAYRVSTPFATFIQDHWYDSNGHCIFAPSISTDHVIGHTDNIGAWLHSQLFRKSMDALLDFYDRIKNEPGSVPLSIVSPPSCNHEFVNVSFNFVKMACKHCGTEISQEQGV
jgi:hypothetical protein